MMEDLSLQLTTQKAQLHRGNNKYLAGITAHNLAVVHVLAGETAGVMDLFREAISLKESAFGAHHFEVALSWDELGIQLFALGQFEQARQAFEAAKNVRSKGATQHPSLAMCLNNIAACEFQMKNHESALEVLQSALQVQQNSVGSSTKGDLDLLHTATVMANCGYLNLCLRMYDEARTHFEEALLIQQSVLDDNHRAVRDTLRWVWQRTAGAVLQLLLFVRRMACNVFLGVFGLNFSPSPLIECRSNLEFTNAFHS